MEIKINYIPHNFRNKYLKNTGGYASSSSSFSSTTGNGLPYVLDENGNYVVEKQVLFKKSIISKEEVVAYGEDNIEGGSGGTCSIEVIDSLDSVSSTAALSARQGKILSELISDKGSVSSWNDIKDKPSTFNPSAHNHTITEITGLQAELNSKASSSHTHSIANITNLQIELNNKSNVNHTHVISAVTGLQTQLDSKVNSSDISTLNVKNSDTVDNLHASSFMRSDTDTTCTGTITCANLVSNGEVTSYSDKRLKTDIRSLDNRGLLNPVVYTKDNKRQIGFIAQDVQEVYPELITEDTNGYLSLNYQQLTAVLSTQINNLYSIINELKLE